MSFYKKYLGFAFPRSCLIILGHRPNGNLGGKILSTREGESENCFREGKENPLPGYGKLWKKKFPSYRGGQKSFQGGGLCFLGVSLMESPPPPCPPMAVFNCVGVFFRKKKFNEKSAPVQCAHMTVGGVPPTTTTTTTPPTTTTTATTAAGSETTPPAMHCQSSGSQRFHRHGLENNFPLPFLSSRVLGFRVHHPFQGPLTHLCDLEAGYGGVSAPNFGGAAPGFEPWTSCLRVRSVTIKLRGPPLFPLPIF